MGRRSRSRRPGFSLVEVLLVLLILGLLVALLFPVLQAAKHEAAVTVCEGHLRQIGMAVTLYREDYGAYPNPPQLVERLHDGELLFCPHDDRHERLASSYTFRTLIPPALTAYWNEVELDPSLVLLSCARHTEAELRPRHKTAAPAPPGFPYLLALRAGGTVQAIRMDRVRELPVPGAHPTFVRSYPGEPGYEWAQR